MTGYTPKPHSSHPLVAEFFHLASASKMPRWDVSRAVGREPTVIAKWHKNPPNLALFDKALGIFGFRLAIVPLDDG